MQTRTLAAALLSAAVPALAAAGCGGNGAAASTTPLVDRQAAELKYVRCLRSHGINAEVTSDGGIGVTFGNKPGMGGDHPAQGSPSEKSLGPPPAMRRAQDACKKYLPKEKDVSPAERAKKQQQALAGALAFARCMRAHGIAWPDPKASGDGGLIQAGPSGVNPNDPAMQRAMKACQKDTPGGPGGGSGMHFNAP